MRCGSTSGERVFERYRRRGSDASPQISGWRRLRQRGHDHIMNARLTALFEQINDLPLWGVTFDHVNVVNCDGDNALHVVVRWNDIEAARLLIDAGINVNQYGDLGNTPLHEACAFGHKEMVRLLVEHGADLYARAEGDTPFVKARLGGHDDICDLLRPMMLDAQKKDPHFWTRMRIAHLQRELHRLEQSLR